MIPKVDLQALIPKRWDDPGITLVVRRAIRFGTGNAVLAVDVNARRVSKNGRDLKSRHVITILGQPEETVPDLLRNLAVAFEQTEPIPVIDEVASPSDPKVDPDPQETP